ncbi:hypothetical protein AB8P51_14980 [Muriicola sp. SD30]|uniref:hypothetical protein n=1 Tax=Muriicola sp. SD30 TaxID=3240936 RepID=UPI00350EC339
MILIGLSSCSEPVKKEIVKVESRLLVVYEFDTITRINDYKLTIKEKDSFTRYEYQNLVDSTKNMDFHFVKNSNKIHFGPEEFNLEEKNIIKNKLNFDRYETEPIPDAMGSLYFNQDYGILGFDNGWGMQFHYLTKENKEQFKLPLFYKMDELDE